MTAIATRPTAHRTAAEALRFFDSPEVLAADARWDAYRRDLAMADLDLADGWLTAPAPFVGQVTPERPVVGNTAHRTGARARYGTAGIVAAFVSSAGVGSLLVHALNSAIA
ncbi:hypothetical protein [Knoellia sp. LjRoot47]|uniref:hypothetical protein n=1 Tax=Knoellia sp. LjRoot47 TaxID=3342330 RepID=UPI003ECFCF9B